MLALNSVKVLDLQELSEYDGLWILEERCRWSQGAVATRAFLRAPTLASRVCGGPPRQDKDKPILIGVDGEVLQRLLIRRHTMCRLPLLALLLLPLVGGVSASPELPWTHKGVQCLERAGFLWSWRFLQFLCRPRGEGIDGDPEES